MYSADIKICGHGRHVSAVPADLPAAYCAKRRTRYPARWRNHSEKRGFMHSIGIRSAESTETDRLAQLWHDGWQDAHADILPAELARYRTLESFRQRLRDDLASVRVAGSPDRPAGFCMIRQGELYQLYVARDARGTGAAFALLADAENRLATAGVVRAWLACAIGNERAMRFYEKHGWSRVGPMTSALGTADGIFELEVWHYEKAILPHGLNSTPRHRRLISAIDMHDQNSEAALRHPNR